MFHPLQSHSSSRSRVFSSFKKKNSTEKKNQPTTSPPQSALAELRSLRASSPDGVISVSTVSDFERLFGAGERKGRPYGLVVFCTARHLLDKPQLGLRKMRREFGVVARAARKKLADHNKKMAAAASASDGGSSGKKSPLDAVFFATLDFETAREAFHRLGVQSLPWIISLSPDAVVPREGDVEILGDAVMRHARYGHRHWVASDFAKFASDRIEAWRAEARAGGGSGSEAFSSSSSSSSSSADASESEEQEEPAIVIEEAPARPSAVNVSLGLATLSLLAAVAWRLYTSRLARSYPLWTLACLGVWWFATSGGMYNIIRGMPMVLPQRDGTVKLFLDGSGQVGFEGFLMGTLYATVGVSLALLGSAATRLSDEGARRAFGYSALCVAWFAYRKVVSIHDWKTSFGWHSFLW